jgi:hypothetical protein
MKGLRDCIRLREVFKGEGRGVGYNLPLIFDGLLYTKKKLIEKIQTYWPEVNRQEIIDLLDQYGVESYEKEVTRVQLAILKLCQGDRSQETDVFQPPVSVLCREAQLHLPRPLSSVLRHFLPVSRQPSSLTSALRSITGLKYTPSEEGFLSF